jgi:hypothetical protein
LTSIWFEALDINRARAFVESADLRETMKKVGVVDKPEIHLLNGRRRDFRQRGEIHFIELIKDKYLDDL